jgi:outer membrane protein assembly factor BamD
VLAEIRSRSAVLIAIVAASVAMSGCAILRHNAKKKEDDNTAYQEAPVDQLYAAGAARLDAHQWSEGIVYFKEVERQHPYSEWSRRAILMQAYAHYEANQYDEAVADANRFTELYPGNPTAAYAYYLKAECYFEEILDVGRDQASTQLALTAMQEVERRFPHTEYAVDAKLKIDMINDQLAGKEMTIGRWYLRRGDTLAGIGRFKYVVDHFQTTSHTQEALYRLVEAYLTLGAVDEAKRDAAVLGYNFPGDPWYADAYKLMQTKGLHPETPEPVNAKSHGFFHKAVDVLTFHKEQTPAPPKGDTVPPAPAAEAQPKA